MAALLLLGSACEDKRAAPTTTDASSAPAVKAPRATVAGADASASPAIAADRGADFGWLFDCNETGTPKSGKSIGHTSVAFKVELSTGKKAAWKPNARTVKDRYKGEIAAFRLARALGIPNVPPACGRAFDAATASAALSSNSAAAKVFAEDVIVEQGAVHGVVIPWIDGLRFWPLEKEPLRTDVHAWLDSAEIPAGKLDLARQASLLVAFDFITGNWDRYSGENVGVDASGTHLLFIDNDAAFMQGPPAEELARNRARLDRLGRFSRSFIATARSLDASQVAAAIGEEAPGRPLLAPAVLANVTRRIVELLIVVDAKIAARGDAQTLYFR